MIEFQNVKKIYISKKGNPTTALNNINIKIGGKGMVFVVGKSGSGKSTFLNLLGGLDQQTSGEILIHGKDISTFKRRQYDSYRNTYIGFIFQEFNILEAYNVYENIELAVQLQNQKIDKKEIDALLNHLGISGLGNRKINELSGGQKQRVAIARALIKKPQIILADEPTGNLDRTSSEQIFTILKEISKEHLVLVVSHDMESAIRYGDRIIGIDDGKIISDSNPNSLLEQDSLLLKKSKLPLPYILKMTLTNLKTKPLKLFMTVLLTTISLIFTGFTVNSLFFDKTRLVAHTMQENQNYVYDVQKSKFDYNGAVMNYELNEEDLSKIEQIVNTEINPLYTLYDNGEVLHFTFGELEEKNDYYKDLWSLSFAEVKNVKILGKMIGREPQKENEIVVHKYFADYVMKKGIMTTSGNFYFPKSYEEFVKDKKKLKLGDNEVVLVGIIDDDNHLFEQAKNDGYFISDTLESHFNQSYFLKASVIYVNGFTKSAHLHSDKESILNKVVIKSQSGNQDSVFLSKTIKALNQKVDCITTSGTSSLSSLDKNQILLSLDDLKKFDSTFDSKFNEYLKTKGNVIYEDALNAYIKLYLQEQSSKLIVKLNIYALNNEADIIQEDKIKVIGVSLDKNSYISYQYVEEYKPVSQKIFSVIVFDDNVKNLKKSLQQLKYREFNPPDLGEIGTFYNYNPVIDVHNHLAQVMSVYHYLYIYILIISLVFLLFTFLLFTNFIATSISYCKKEIGILRALGARNIDVIKIFGYESLFIGILSWILSMFGWIAVCHILNKSLFSNMYYTVNGIITHPFVPVLMFVYTIFISIFITVISIKRITKIKPIEAILNK